MGEVSNKSNHYGYCFVNIVSFFFVHKLITSFGGDLGLDTDFHNQELDYPTVTICPLEPWDEENVNETAYKSANRNGDEDNYREYMTLLEMLAKLSYENFDMMYETIKSTTAKFSNKTTLRQLVFQVAMKCDDLFYACKYRGEEISCWDYFTPVYSERGFCYSFNARYYGTADEE